MSDHLNGLEELESAISSNRALPPWAFRDPQYAEHETLRTFYADWVFVDHESRWKQPGDRLALTVGGEPVVVVKQKDGSLKALSNVCRHRGTQVVEGFSNGKKLVCPYHAWTYSLEGRLQGVPFADSGMDKQKLCLREFALCTWSGLVFVSLNDQVRPLDRRLAGLNQHVDPYAPTTLVVQGDPEEHAWNVNWKVVFENAMESYHLFCVHKDTLETVTPTKQAFHVEGSSEWAVTGGEGEQPYSLVCIPPSFVGIFSEGGLMWLSVDPASATACRVRTGGAFYPVELGLWDKLLGSGTREYEAFVQAFMAEDEDIVTRVQLGLQTRLIEPGPLLQVERIVSDFHHYLGTRLFGSDPHGS